MDEGLLYDISREVYLGWMGYFKSTPRDEKLLIHRLRRVKELLEAAGEWPPTMRAAQDAPNGRR
jgi:hypothetical protein